MKKQLIYFNENEYKRELNNLENIINVINKYTNTLNVCINRELLYAIYDSRIFKKEYYLNELKKVSEFFGVDFNEVMTFEYTFKNPIFKDMASNKCRQMFEFTDELKKYMYNNKWLIEYIDICDNIATKTINADNELKEHFNTYIENDDENTVYNKLKEILAIYKELNGIIKRKDLESILSYKTNEIDINKFKYIMR